MANFLYMSWTVVFLIFFVGKCVIKTQENSNPPPIPPPTPAPRSETSTTINPTPPDLVCEAEETSFESRTISWPATGSDEFSISNPLCINENMEIVKRKCAADGKWEPAVCPSIQEPITNPCPPDLENWNNKYCYIIIKKTTFPPKCPYQGYLNFDKYVELKWSADPIWMPLSRETNGPYGIDLMRWIEPTENFKIPYQRCFDSCRKYIYSGSMLDKTCQIYHNKSTTEAVRCDSEHSAICAYDMLQFRKKGVCIQFNSNCRQSGYSTNSDCFCIENSKSEENSDEFPSNLADFIFPYQNFIYYDLNVSCVFGLQKSEKSFIWSTPSTPITYTNWDNGTDIDFKQQYGVTSSGGWSLTDTMLSCYLYQTAPPLKSGELALSYNINKKQFELTIKSGSSWLYSENNSPLVYCFSDADATELFSPIKNVSVKPDSNDVFVYSFSALGVPESGPGYYWCEAFLYPNLPIVSSNRVLLQKNDSFLGEYVVLLRVKNYVQVLSDNPLIESNLALLQHQFINFISSQEFFPRIYKINDIDEEKKQMSVTFHLSSSSSVNSIDEFNHLKNAVVSALVSQTIFDFMDFRSVNYCLVETLPTKGQNVTWPTTPIHHSVNPNNGYCVTTSGTLVQRTCKGNFIDGATWSRPEDDCFFYAASDITKVIIQVLNQNQPVFSLDQIFKVSTEYSSFSPLDVVLLANYLQNISFEKPNMEVFANVISNIMLTSSPVLQSAQLNFKATDKVLRHVDEILINADNGSSESPNFIVKSINVKDTFFRGILLTDCTDFTNNCTVTVFSNNTNSKYLNGELYAALILSDDLFNQILKKTNLNETYVPNIIIAIYYGSSLFVETDTLKGSSFVFGVLLPDFHEKFDGPLSVVYQANAKDNLLEYNCSYWNFSMDSYSVWEQEKTTEENATIACEFWHVTHFGFPRKFVTGHENIFKTKKNRNLILTKSNETNKLVETQYRLQQNMFSQTPIHMPFSKSLSHLINFVNPMLVREFETKVYPVNEQKNKIVFDVIDNYNYIIDSNVNKTFSCKYDIESIIETYSLMCNITKKLDNILNKIGNNNHGYRLSDLETALLSCNSQVLDGYDLQLVTNILSLTATTSEISNLDSLANILNILTNLPKNLVADAQQSHQLADKILFSVDQILIKYNKSIVLQKQNVGIVVVSTEDTYNFSGIYTTSNYKVKLLTSPVNKEAHFVLKVAFSRNLQDQIRQKTRLIFVIFHNSILFPANSATTEARTVVEILFPDLKEIKKEKFSLIYSNYKHEQQVLNMCSYWDHEITEENSIKPGYWKHEFTAALDDKIATCTFQHATHFAIVRTIGNITTNLEDILSSNLTGKDKLGLVEGITRISHQSLVPVDIFLISQILNDTLNESVDVVLTSGIISNLFNVPRTILKRSQVNFHATDMILHAIDETAKQVDDANITNENFALIVKNLDNDDLMGIMLRDCSDSMCTIDQLNTFINLTDYSDDDTVSAMLVFSEPLVDQIRNRSNTKVIISTFYSDVFFNEVSSSRSTTKVFGVVFPGIEDSLEGTLSIVYNVGSKSGSGNKCAYWDYKASPNDPQPGEWKNDVDKQREDKMAICSFSHVTHFAMLLEDDDDADYVLGIITDINCCLSLVGILAILFTAILFKKWRQNTGNILLINFSLAISLKICMLYVSEYVRLVSSGTACTITGVILHYAILSECCWMLTIAILQFKRFVEVLGGPPKFVLVKAFICGWLFPLLPVICVVAIDPDNYEKGNSGLCYPSHLGLYLGVWLPVLLIVSINCVIFIFIIYNVFHKKTEYIDSANHDILFQWRLALLLFFMLGLTWLFGFFGQIKGDTLFTYLYCITASLQGFVMFLFFIVFNKSTRLLYSQSMKQWFYSRGFFKVGQKTYKN